MRILAIDLGTKTMGLAITDEKKTIASPIENYVYPNCKIEFCVRKILQILNKYNDEVDKIIIGYPTSIHGYKNTTTRYVENFISILSKKIKIKIIKFDERFSTVDSIEMLKIHDIKFSKIKKIKDKMSATLILDRYINSI
jgi:putative Holliday junction resolvase